MTKLSCTWAELRGDVRHAASCPRCAARAGFDRAIAAAMPGVPMTPDVDRALARAFAQRPAQVARRWPMLAGVAFAAAAVALVVAWPRAHDEALPAGVATAVAHAQVTPAAGARVMVAGDHEVALVAGSVDVDVDPGPHAPFRVSTPRFAVDVLGTQFTVTLDGVRVARGAVRVVSLDGTVIAARVAAGESWRFGEVVASASGSAEENQRRNDGTTERRNDGTEITNAVNGPPAPTNPTSTNATSTNPTSKNAHDHSTPHDPHPTTAPDAKSAHARIAEARTALTSHDVAGARKVLDGVLASKLAAADRVDAERAYAESYIGNDPEEAQHRFEAIGDEDALFTAARQARKRGATDDERRLLALYLDRFSKGSLRAEAQKRLDALGATAK